MEGQRKIRQSHLLLSIPVLASILLYIYCFILRSFVIGVADLKLGDLSGYIGVLLSVVMLFIHKLWFRPEYKGSFRRDLLMEKTVLIPLIVYCVFDLGIIAANWVQSGVQMPTAAIVGTALMAGVGEEVSYRVVMMTTELRIWVRRDSYLPALLIASLTFGLGHALNLLAGASLSMTLLQVCETIAAGIFMGSLFIRTGNLLYPLLVHVFHDLLALMTCSSSVVQTRELTMDDVVWNGIVILVQILITVWLLRGRKEEIISIWKERWSVSDK